MYSVELLAVAEQELSDSYDWYEEQQAGLGNKFYREIDRLLSLIGTNPHHYIARYAGELHTAPLKKFPFLIIYWVDTENQTVFVASVFHTSRQSRTY